MARKRRFIHEGFCYHVMLRGNGGQDIFKDDADRTRFLQLFQYAKEKFQLNIHGFCLMGNHVHLIIQPQTSSLTSGMHSLAFRYAQHFNKKYKRRGYLYQGRYKAVMVQSGTYLRRLVRYIHLNPVRAGIVRKAEEYFWSSHRAYSGEVEYAWLDHHLVLDAFGGNSDDTVKGMVRYIDMNDDKAREEAIEIRKSLRKGIYGDDDFLDEWCPSISWTGGDDDFWQGDTNETPIETIVEAVCDRFETTIEDLRSESRSKTLVQARSVIANLTRRFDAGSMTSLGRHISRDGTSLAKLAKKSESDSQLQSLADQISEALIAGG